MTFGFGMPRGVREDPYGESAGSALLDAINRNKVHLARFILDANDEDTLTVVNTRDFKGKTPLTRAVYITEEKSRQRAMNLLLQHGANPNMQDDYGRTALSYACELRHNDVVKLLMKWNIDPDLPDCLGNTPLMYCAAVGNDTAVGILLKCFRRLGLVVDRGNKEGFTALHIAAKNGFTECAARLAIEGHASVTQPDQKYGRTAEQWARAQGCATPEVALFSTAAQKLCRPRANLRVYNRLSAYPSSKTSPVRTRGNSHNRIDVGNVTSRSDMTLMSRDSHTKLHNNTPRGLPSVELQLSPRRGHFASNTSAYNNKEILRSPGGYTNNMSTQFPTSKGTQTSQPAPIVTSSTLRRSRTHPNVSVGSDEGGYSTDDMELNESFTSNLSLHDEGTDTTAQKTLTEAGGGRVLNRQRVTPMNIQNRIAPPLQLNPSPAVALASAHVPSTSKPIIKGRKQQQHPSISSINTASRIDLEFEEHY